MGSSQSQPNKSTPEIKGNYYGGKLTTNKKTMTTYQQFVIQQRHYEYFFRLIKSRKQLQHQRFVTIKNYWKKQQKTDFLKCQVQKKYQIYVQYPMFEQSLSQKLDECAESNRSITQKQIKQIFIPVLECLIFLEQNNTCHGDIKPSNIMFDHKGMTKLLDSYFINGGKTSYEIVMEDPSSMSLLSPEQLDKLTDKQFDSIEDIHCNEMWSLGLCFYECMTFEPAMQCYDLDKLKIKNNFFEGKDRLMFNNGFSPKLINAVIQGILMKKSNQRLKFQQLLNILTEP